MTKRIHFPMHTLAIGFDLAPRSPYTLLWVGCRMGNGSGCGTGFGTGVLGPIKKHPCISYDLDDNYHF